jgi:hypothetical protein
MHWDGGVNMRMYMPAIIALFLSLSPALAAPGVPILNVKPTCQAGESAAIGPGPSYLKVCLQGEEAARDQLKKSWAGFPVADRRECAQTATIGPPSYVDLLTCLEMRRDAREP